MRKFLFFIFLILFVTQHISAQTSIKPKGTPQKVTSGEHYFMRPSWSPDGEKLAFTSVKQQGIWLLDVSSGETSQLVDKAGAGFKFAWSPDGNHIAYRARYTENKRSKMAIEVVDLSSKKITALTSKEKYLGTPQWGKDNTNLFFTRKQQIKKVETGISDTKQLSKKSLPAKQELPFTHYNQLNILQLDIPDSVTKPIPQTEVINPEISPSGNYIVGEEYGGDLFVLDLENNRRINLGEGHRPHWSPDGKWVCYMITEDDGHQYLSSDIYISGIDGKQRFKLTDTPNKLEMNPSWSPDGNAIAYDEYQTGVIYIQQLQFK